MLFMSDIFYLTKKKKLHKKYNKLNAKPEKKTNKQTINLESVEQKNMKQKTVETKTEMK